MKRFLLVFTLLLISSNAGMSEIRTFSHGEVPQGRSFLVYIDRSSDESSFNNIVSADLVFDGKKILFYPYENGFRAIVGCEPEKKPGDYPVRVDYADIDGKSGSKELTINISSKKYPKVSFWLKPSKKKLLTPDLIADEWGVIEAKLVKESAQKLWDGFFLKPVPGITTMPFGTRELVNGKPRSRHRGQDFRAKVGTPIKAAHSGNVVVAQFFKAFGGTVVIDHGQGINTLYFHLSKIHAVSGQDLRKGEIIGLSGNTGISSGPHLHWGMSAHNVRVDPMQWVETVIP